MQIKRDYSKPFFRRKEKNSTRRNLLIMLGGLIALTTFLTLRPDMVNAALVELLGSDAIPTPAPATLASHALDLYWAGDLEAAAETMAQALQQRPDSIDYLYEYGQLLIDLDRPQEAEDLAAQLLSINPSDPRGYALRARALVWQENSASAAQAALAGLEIDPQFGPLHAALARAYVEEGNLREAQESGIAAIEYAPGDARSYWAYATALAGSGARDEAIEVLQQAISIHPIFMPPYLEQAYFLYAANRDEEAIDVYNQVLGVQPRNARALLGQCRVYLKIGQSERALGFCQDAVDSDPEDIGAQYNLGILLYNNFDFPNAQQAFQMCVQLDNDNLECKYRLGLSYYYLARDTYRLTCEGSRDVLSCEAYDECQTSWDLLQQSLLLAQSRSNVESEVDTIREGLGAISTDPACLGVSGREIFAPEITPEATEAVEID